MARAQKEWLTVLFMMTAFGCQSTGSTAGPPAGAPAKPPIAGAPPPPAVPEAAAEPPAEAAEARSDADAAIDGREVTYSADGVTMKGYVASDPSVKGKRPGILIVHEWWGHNEYVRRRARMLAKLGYVALAVDMYGDGKQAAHPDDAKKFAMAVFGNMDGAVKRFEAARKLLGEQQQTDPEKIAAVGYCFGGGIVLTMARRGVELDGVASFHGSLSTQAPARKGAIKAKLLILHGAEDKLVPADQVEAFKSEMKNAGADMKFVAYPGAKHAFTNPDATAAGEKFKLPVAYNETADKQSWAELEQFLETLYPRE
ncbi:MAG TPA: dienelactone hydrolase family protein [Polyangiaceae bacterium]|jgi:dienelactone hydrolase